MTPPLVVDAVVIGRNEGARLIGCLDSMMAAGLRHVVYVDSGSTDDSIAEAERRGVRVLRLDLTVPFTAARARNAGVAALPGGPEAADCIQFIDGDCIMDPGWLPLARKVIAADPAIAVLCGRRREMAPERSVYNRIIDREWDTPIGETRACGGDALMRREAFAAVGGFDPALIAGEEPELCVRLRQAGWTIRRLDAEMTRHDAAITRFGQWWRRSRRAGHAYAEGAALHGAAPEFHNVAQMRRALFWGLVLPVCAVLGAVLIDPLFLGLLVLWPLQALRLGWRDGDLARGALLVIGKIPEMLGILEYRWRRLTRRRARLIEYK